MDVAFFENLLNQAGGLVIAALLLLRIEKRLDVLISDLEAFISSMNQTILHQTNKT